MFEAILSFLPRAIAQGIPLLFGSTGEIITQKSGNMNLGIPGVMYVGGICGVIGSFVYEQSLPSPDALNPVLAVLIPTLFCLVGSLLMRTMLARTNEPKVLRSFFKSDRLRPQALRRFSFCELFLLRLLGQKKKWSSDLGVKTAVT